jgi:F-type H+-transporting ATPase subunit epsilon
MAIRCEIVSQDRTVFEGDVDMVVLPGAEGEMGILPHHAPLLTTLKYGVVKVRVKGREELFSLAGGVAEIQPDIVTVLANSAENIEEIDLARAEAARKRAEEALAHAEQLDPERLLIMEAALRRSNLRIELVHRYRHRAERGPRPTGEQ